QAPEHVEPDFLNEVVHALAPPQEFAQEVAQARPIPLHQAGERLVVAGLTAQHQELLADLLQFVTHAPDGLARSSLRRMVAPAALRAHRIPRGKARRSGRWASVLARSTRRCGVAVGSRGADLPST